jgi:hypothetical protein
MKHIISLSVGRGNGDMPCAHLKGGKKCRRGASNVWADAPATLIYFGLRTEANQHKKKTHTVDLDRPTAVYLKAPLASARSPMRLCVSSGSPVSRFHCPTAGGTKSVVAAISRS